MVYDVFCQLEEARQTQVYLGLELMHHFEVMLQISVLALIKLEFGKIFNLQPQMHQMVSVSWIGIARS